MFPGRKLKTYQVSVVTFWVMVLMLLGRKLKTYQLGQCQNHGEEHASKPVHVLADISMEFY